MSNLLEITGDDIAKLNDINLRSLIGRLCEADYRSAGLSTKGITWSGHQDARDGGLDVVVQSEESPSNKGYVPRPVTGYQVKKSDMPRGKILAEMKPKGALRGEIVNLIKENGAYIIVSAASTSNSALRNRKVAMQAAVADIDNHEMLYLDFYDRGCIASWVRSHASLILWVRDKIGQPIIGWHGYANWSNPEVGVDEVYLFDDSLRLQDLTTRKSNELMVKDGLETLCNILSKPSSAVRLTGLSGVGKTRLVQALFDGRVVKNALNPDWALYTDISYDPDPGPTAFAEQLIAAGSRAVMIVDNCPPELHTRLMKTCSGSQSSVSLLTVEYDIRDSFPEETSVLRLLSASDGIIERLVQKRFSHISQVDARTIAYFSGGNARVALALSNTVQLGETLSGLRDEELFDRLFWQRNDPDANLLRSAEMCALVYSFEGTDTESEKSELNILASLVNKTGVELYRDVATLRGRDLVQARSVWRAVLPQAIANRLAKHAINHIPKDLLTKSILENGSERLIKSFTRRLGYLHDSDAVVEIVNDWLAPSGWIGKHNCKFSDFGLEVFSNISPVLLEKALASLERAVGEDEGEWFTSTDNKHCESFVNLLRKIAYEAELFDRSVHVLCRFCLVKDTEKRYNHAREVLKSLFYLFGSGTQATVEAKTKVIEGLIGSGNNAEQELGYFLLDAALESWDFRPRYEYSFGARSRDFGYKPGSEKEIVNWYEAFIKLCTHLALSFESVSNPARKLLSNHLRGLWTRMHLFYILEKTITQIHTHKFWYEGWIAVCGIIKHDSKFFDEEILLRLRNLEKTLHPTKLIDKVRVLLVSDQFQKIDIEDIFNDEEESIPEWQLVENATRFLGKQVAQDFDVLAGLLPEIVSAKVTRIAIFGEGLADGSVNKRGVWQALYDQLAQTQPGDRDIRILLGFLSSCACSDPAFFNKILDDLVKDNLLGEWFPQFQTVAPIDLRGIERIHESLEYGVTPTINYACLSYGHARRSINDDDLAGILEKLLARKDGYEVVIEILAARQLSSQSESNSASDRLAKVALETLKKFYIVYGKSVPPAKDRALAKIVGLCTSNSDIGNVTVEIGRHMVQAINKGQVYAFDYPSLTIALAKADRMTFLDIFLGDGQINDSQVRYMFGDIQDTPNSPMSLFTDEEVIDWCNRAPSSRFPRVASAIQAFKKSVETDEYEWKPIVHLIFQYAPDMSGVLENLSAALGPISGFGSLASALRERGILFKQLFSHDNEIVRSWAEDQYSILQNRIEMELATEKSRSHDLYEHFE
jgi:hypothetical protein